MMRFLRASALSAAVLIALLSCRMSAEPPVPKEEARSDFTLLPEKSRYVSHLEKARAAIDEKDWPVAATLLQKMLDLREDSLVPITRKGPGGKAEKALVSLRGEAEAMLAALPPAG